MKITTLMLGELASNCYIQEVGNKKCVIVDIGGDAPIVFRRLEMMQLEPLAILLTHGHYDHIAGVEQVREKYQIPVYVHSLDANMLTDSRANLGDWLSTQPFQPVQEWKTVEDGDTLQFGDNTFTVIHTPGIHRAAFACKAAMCCTPETHCSGCPVAERIFQAAAMHRCWNLSGN